MAPTKLAHAFATNPNAAARAAAHLRQRGYTWVPPATSARAPLSIGPLAPRDGFGSVEPIHLPEATSFGPEKVYVLHLKGTTPPRAIDAADLLEIARGVGRAYQRGGTLHMKTPFQVRGVAYYTCSQTTIDDDWAPQSKSALCFDVVLTYPSKTLGILGAPKPHEIAKQILLEPDFQARFGQTLSLSTTSAGLYELTGPTAAIQHWKAQPVLWDPALGDDGLGGPSDAFAKPQPYQLVYGEADEGAKAQPVGFYKPVLGGGPKQPAGSDVDPVELEKKREGQAGLFLLVAVGIGIALVAVKQQQRKKREGIIRP